MPGPRNDAFKIRESTSQVMTLGSGLEIIQRIEPLCSGMIKFLLKIELFGGTVTTSGMW